MTKVDQVESMWTKYDQSEQNGLKQTEYDQSTQHKYKRNIVCDGNSCFENKINKIMMF